MAKHVLKHFWISAFINSLGMSVAVACLFAFLEAFYRDVLWGWVRSQPPLPGLSVDHVLQVLTSTDCGELILFVADHGVEGLPVGEDFFEEVWVVGR